MPQYGFEDLVAIEIALDQNRVSAHRGKQPGDIAMLDDKGVGTGP